MRKVSCVFIVGLMALGLMGCGAVTEETPAPDESVPYEKVVSVTGQVVPGVWASVSAQVGGAVVAVTVQEGDDVAANSLLVGLDSSQAQAAVAQAEAALVVAQAQLAQARTRPRREEVAVARAQLDAAVAAVAQASARRDEPSSEAINAEIAVARARVAAAEAEQVAAREAHEQTMKCHNVTQSDGSQKRICPNLGTIEEQARRNLHAANEALAAVQSQLWALVSGAEDRHRVAEAGVDVAEAQLEVARAQLELLQVAPPSERISVAEASVAQAEVALETAREALARFEVCAPFDGTVGAVLVRVGEVVAPGQPLVTLGDLTTMRVETTDLDEVDVARVAVGQSAIAAFDALPDKLLVGRVARVSPMASAGSGGVNYRAIIELEDIAPPIRWGMTAFVDIEVE